ncbi:MAG: flagellar motor protein MotD, partial [Gammaproteobacteria bacterium]|nr:flagellar motor protein MotD [Gammaproteobacteria bacterium]
HLFTKYGVNPERLSSIGYAEFRPKSENETEQGRMRNRRVKVVILADKNARRIAEIDRVSGQSKKEGVLLPNSKVTTEGK